MGGGISLGEGCRRHSASFALPPSVAVRWRLYASSLTRGIIFPGASQRFST